MGTPRVSDAPDQMRRAQFSARIGGECAKKSGLAVLRLLNGKPWTKTNVRIAGAMITLDSSCARLFASGGVTGAVLLCDSSQQVLFAQHAGLHAFSVALFERMHARAESGKGAATIVSAISNENAILPAINPFIAQQGP